METDKVKQEEILFYKHFVHGVINRRKKNEPDSLPTSFINYYPNINFIIEVNSCTFFDTIIKLVDVKIETSAFKKTNIMPIHGTSKIPERYKKNAITGDLN